MARACFDSTIPIDYLNGIQAAAEAIVGCDEPVISIVTWIEVLAGARGPAEETAAHGALGRFTVVDLTPAVAAIAAVIRRERRLKLPDAVILATARHLGCPLVTRNTKDFERTGGDVVVPYEL